MISTIVSAVAAIGGLATSVNAINKANPTDEELFKKSVKYGLDDSDSVIEFTRLTRCEPIGMIDHTIILNPVLPDLLSTLTHIYAVMYSQAFSLAINARIGDINVIRVLDKINPNRDIKKAAYALESHSLVLPNYKRDVRSTNKISLESNNNNRNNNNTNENDRNGNSNNNVRVTLNRGREDLAGNKQGDYNYKPEASRVGISDDNLVKFHPNLTTGVTFKVSVNADSRSIEIPITMRVLANSIADDNIVSILEAGVTNRTVKERWRGWRSGELAFWKDLVLCRDILRADRANLIKDKTGLYTEITKRRSNNTLAGFTSGDTSISQISNILVVSQYTIDEFERVSLKKLNNNKVRETLFNATQIMMLAVVDVDMETVTIYYHDITIPTTVTFKELKSNSKKGNVDPMEILKAYQMGNGIRL